MTDRTATGSPALQLKTIADLILKFYPNEIKEGESPVDVVCRLLSPTEIVNGNNAMVPSWAVDTLAKKELKRLAQYVLNSHANYIGNTGIVDTVIGMIEKAYL